MRVMIDGEVMQNYYLDGLGSVPSEQTNPSCRVFSFYEVSLDDKSHSYCIKLVLLNISMYEELTCITGRKMI
jgi:hypothetical protein